jgi:hypothetical protein
MRLRLTRPGVETLTRVRFLPYLRPLARPERGPEYEVTKVLGIEVPLGITVFNRLVSRVWQYKTDKGVVSWTQGYLR